MLDEMMRGFSDDDFRRIMLRSLRLMAICDGGGGAAAVVEDGLADRGAAGGWGGDLGVGAVGVAAADDGGDGAHGRRSEGAADGLVLAGFFLRLGARLRSSMLV